MSSTLKVINSLEVETRGRTITGAQGEFDDAVTDPFEFTVLGQCHQVPFTLPTADAAVLWAAADDDPATFEYAHYVADEDTFLQLITAGGQVSISCRAFVPQTIGEGTILPSASTTPLDGLSSPSVTAILKIVACNTSGNSTDGVLTVVK